MKCDYNQEYHFQLVQGIVEHPLVKFTFFVKVCGVIACVLLSLINVLDVDLEVLYVHLQNKDLT